MASSTTSPQGNQSQAVGTSTSSPVATGSFTVTIKAAKKPAEGDTSKIVVPPHSTLGSVRADAHFTVIVPESIDGMMAFSILFADPTTVHAALKGLLEQYKQSGAAPPVLTWSMSIRRMPPKPSVSRNQPSENTLHPHGGVKKAVAANKGPALTSYRLYIV
ncbi:hypothetical protein P389DRAFT_177665 [Cystobasidium minutum MCA 4210]|uniref:uncharacterized protein n=1 Tax=Cystobasidium minutum MCA 4210 TaxID=1397322 RepID=UPI0034CE9BFF|eukprot:jgi/Rhomi1/177665/fgenesh1_pg.2_\